MIHNLLTQFQTNTGIPLVHMNGTPSTIHVTTLCIPNRILIPLFDAFTPYTLHITHGEMLQEGTLIADNTVEFIHSSIPGHVIDIILPKNNHKGGVIIQFSGSFIFTGKEYTPYPWKNLMRQTLINIIKTMGVIGLNTQWLPMHSQIFSDDHTAHNIIIDGSEVEPYQATNACFFSQYCSEIITGIQIIEYIFQYPHISITFNDTHTKLSAHFKKLIQELDVHWTIIHVQSSYPQGSSEHLLVERCHNIIIPYSTSILKQGFAVFSISMIYAMYEAIHLQKPVIEIFISVGGNAIKTPKLIKARIGTPISTLLDECDGFLQTPEKIIINGVFSGKSITNIHTPVTKGIHSITALTKNMLSERTQEPCIQCGECVRRCPVSLNPSLLYKMISKKHYQNAHESLFYCIECGVCEYICPSRIPLLQHIRAHKAKLNTYKEHNESV